MCQEKTQQKWRQSRTTQNPSSERLRPLQLSSWFLPEKSLPVSASNASSVYKQRRTIDDEQIKAIAGRKGLIGVMAIARTVKARDATVEDLVDHIEYMVNLVGIDYVGMGFDFTKNDGPRSVKEGHHPIKRLKLIKDFEEIEDLPKLIVSLSKRGFHEDEIKKILGENYLRIFRQVLN